jgi:hypothetical protein
VLLDNVYGIHQQKYDVAITTVVAPMYRSFAVAVSICFMSINQSTALVIMYITLLYLAFLLSSRKYESGDGLHRLDLVIELYLTYLLMLLTDFVQDSVHYQSISNQFIYGTLAMISIAAVNLTFLIL